MSHLSHHFNNLSHLRSYRLGKLVATSLLQVGLLFGCSDHSPNPPSETPVDAGDCGGDECEKPDAGEAGATVVVAPPVNGSDAGTDCAPGSLACSCTSDSLCDEELTCNQERDLCVSQECEPGEASCGCLPDGDCNDGLSCSAGLCLPKAAPAEPKCYSPCHDDLHVEIDGQETVIECGADGLMEHCLGQLECVQGSCVAPDEAPLTCDSELECPDFQTCVGNQCYSECERHSECTEGLQCHRRVCRQECDGTSGSCPTGLACHLVEQEHGYCVPFREADSTEQQKSIAGRFEVSNNALQFSNTRIQRTITLSNLSTRAVEFTLTKLSHTEYSRAGSVLVQDNPLPFILLGRPGEAKRDSSIAVAVGAGESTEVEIVVADDGGVPDAWNGTLQLSSSLGSEKISVSYASGVEGRWAGSMYYFAQFGDRNLSDWQAVRATGESDAQSLQQVGNALLQKWNLFKSGRMTLNEFNAVMTATTSGSWNWPSVRSACEDEWPGVQACYLFDDPSTDSDVGVRTFSDSLDDQPVPSGVVELPLALDLAQSDSPTLLRGRIASQESLHFSGDPALELEFASSPSCDGDANNCIVPVKSLSANAVIGGRYQAIPGDRDCEQADDYQQVAIPWLVPGFTRGAEVREGQSYKYECRDRLLPFTASGDGKTPVNLSLAQSNPIADARSRQRSLRLLDGILINQNELVLLVEERFDASFLGTTDEPPLSAYGLMLLRRSRAQLDETDFQGVVQADKPRHGGIDLAADVACPAELVEQALGAEQDVTAENADSLARTLLTGLRPNAESNGNDTFVYPAEQVHYLCVDSGQFDQLGCTDGVFFAFTESPTHLEDHACQSQTGACAELLSEWAEDGSIDLDLVWNCPDPAVCGADDLRLGKSFYAKQGEAVFLPLQHEVEEAFVYKTRFRNRAGTSLGFTPLVCDANRSTTPYCYDPQRIEAAQERVDCLLYTYSDLHENLEPETRTELKAYLEKNFSYTQTIDPALSLPVTHDGFERLNAELLIMLGDDAYTRAFQARFDLANSLAVSFEGSQFEPGGIDLSGVAGYEMFVLYQSAQYYQMVLDRFYRLSPMLWASLRGDPGRSFVKQETIVSYFDRVLRASAQKSRAWSEVGRRYQRLARPALARAAVERAYAASYLESVVLTQLMRRAAEVLSPEQRAQVQHSVDQAQLTYGSALLDMRDVYEAFGDQLNTFGFTDDYVPFPALDGADRNAFVNQLDVAEDALQRAAQDEAAALSSTREFDTNQEQFSAELANIQRDAETQLGQLCGVFVGEDGREHPASSDYAHLDPKGRVLGDLCGLVDNGSIHEATLELELQQLEAKSVLNAFEDQQAQIDIEMQRVSDQCDLAYELADVQFENGERTSTLADEVARLHDTQAELRQNFDIARQAIEMGVCTIIVGVATGGDCPTALSAVGLLGSAAAAFMNQSQSFDDDIREKQTDIRNIELSTARFATEQQCDQAQVNSAALIKNLTLQFKNLELEALKAGKQLQLGLSRITQLRSRARRVQLEQTELKAQVINLEAARNDPNVRLYKNSDVLNAERSFYVALQEAYKATKVFEYYTSQSYAHRGDLHLLRLVERGDKNLEGYLQALERSYRDFGERVGTPEARLDVLSLRDDILAIPRIDAAGRTLTQAERTALFRTELTSSRALNNQGYWSTAFSTSGNRLSPVTRNHKLRSLQAEFIGADVGDSQGRVYLVPSGTSTVLTVNDEALYFRLPKRTAVINTFFNGSRPSDASVYSNEQLRDRPYLNTHWKFFINQRDEQANQDIDLNSLTDVRLYLYYTDVAAPGGL